MTRSPRRGFLLLLTALSFLIVAPAAFAVSLYDIIQLAKKGYRDNQIISIIETTDSRFQVDADTVLTLKREGLSEKVIQAIVARSDGPPDTSRDTVREEQPPRDAQPSSRDDGWRTRGDRAPAAQAEPPHQHDEADADDDHAVPSKATVPAGHAHPATSATSFSYFPFEENGAGHHQHIALALGDVPIIVLRSEGGYASIAQRAHAAADALNRAVSEGLALTSSNDGVIARASSGEAIPILRVERGDVVSLQRRSAGVTAPARIASYWAALLGDYVDLAAGREPTHLASSGIGSIRSLYRELAAAPASNDRATAEASTSLAAAVDRMSPEDRQALIDLAGQIPARFRIQER